MKRTITKAALFFICGALAISSLLFTSAGTEKYLGGIMFLFVLLIPMFFSGIIMIVKCPKLLERRLESKEQQKGQGKLVIISAIMFVSGFVAAGIDYRCGISQISLYTQIAACIVFLFGYCIYFVVLFQNEFLSRTIKVTENQKVIDTGLYSVIRHPMYTATIIMFLSMPIILGSYISLIFFLIYPFIILRRILLEEEFLEKELHGYKEYKAKVRYRLVPYIW